MSAVRRWWAFHRLERARWRSPRWQAAALAALLLALALAPRPERGAARAPSEALAEADAAAAALRFALLFLPLSGLLFFQAQRVRSALEQEFGAAAWPGARGARALARLSSAWEQTALWWLVAALVVGLGLPRLQPRLFSDEPTVPALFEQGAYLRFELPAATAARTLEVALASVPRRSPEAQVDLRLLGADGQLLGQRQQTLAGRRRLRLEIPPGSAPHTLQILRQGGGAGLRLEPSGLVWLGAPVPGLAGSLALGLRVCLAAGLLLALVEVLRRGLGSGLASASALLAWALWPPDLPGIGELGAAGCWSAWSELSQGAAPAWPEPAALAALPLAALLALGASALGSSAALFREPGR